MIAIGSEFKVVGTLYWHDVALNLNKRTVDLIELLPLRLSGAAVLARHLVPLGSRIQFLSLAPQRWPSFLYAPQYHVQVDRLSAPTGVPVVLALSRGNEGSSTPLNPEIYRPL